VVAALVTEKVPTWQFVQVDKALFVENVPAWQFVQVGEALPVENVPATQSEHIVLLVTSEYFPTEQAVQGAIPVEEKYPVLHTQTMIPPSKTFAISPVPQFCVCTPVTNKKNTGSHCIILIKWSLTF
jgi:hypothetical protein